MKTMTLHRDERGLSLIEMIIALLIYGIVLAAALGVLAKQNTLFHRGLDRMTSLQSARFAMGTLETDVVTLGTNTTSGQPGLVYGGRDVIAFHADYASNIPNDVFASYIDESAPTGQVTTPRIRTTLPNTVFAWPDSVYKTAAGTASSAELLIFYFTLDTSTPRADDYALYRKVNEATPAIVARHILPVTGTPFFRYFRRKDFASAPTRIDSIPDASLPVRHSSPMHGTPADTGSSAVADSVRAVRVSFRTTNGLLGADQRISEVSQLITMPNAGLGVFGTCGDPPILGVGINAVVEALPLGAGNGVRLTWNRAIDESGGELDVVRYVVYRQAGPLTADWGDPLLSIPAGNPSYSFLDETVYSGTQYTYALAGQDCTPSLSTLAPSISVTP